MINTVGWDLEDLGCFLLHASKRVSTLLMSYYWSALLDTITYTSVVHDCTVSEHEEKKLTERCHIIAITYSNHLYLTRLDKDLMKSNVLCSSNQTN